jgi:hypothetical protein
VSGIVWEDPPAAAKTGQPTVWPQILAPLTERPREWARVRTNTTARASYQTAQNLRNGSVRVPPGRWEFRGVKTPDGGAVYARYLGPDAKPQAIRGVS